MAVKETQSQKIQRISKIREKIRNICTSAHIHHGKCISGDSRILLAGGSIKTAKELFESISANGEVYQENEEHTIFSPKGKTEIFSLNKDTGKMEKKEIQYAWRLLGGKTIKIKLRNGFQIETTPEHKYLISKNGELSYIEAEDLRLGDRIVCPRKLDVANDTNIKKEILEKLSNENFYVNLKLGFHNFLKQKILEFGIKKLKDYSYISIKARSFYHGVWQNRYNLKDLINICQFFGVDLELVYNNIESIFYRTGKQRGHNSLKMKLPENFEEFFYLAGLFIGDGSERKFIVGKEELGVKLTEICRNLGIEVKRRQWKEKTPEIHTNLTLVNVLKALFDYPLRKKSWNIKVSNFVFGSNKKYISDFLKGYFDTDGCVEKSRRAITISSASDRMIEDLHLLLLRFGIIAIKEKDNTLSISGLSAINFEKEISFGLIEKAEKLKNLIKKVSGSIVCDTIKVGDQVMLINNLLKNKLSGELAFIEIKSIESGFQDVVYDFTIPENHNFAAEGIIMHNTAMTDNLLAASGYMAAKYAGDLEQGMATWQHSDEQERLLTVDAANVSMVHQFQGEEYLINLIDTPGHVDFSGNVTRAMRAIDGTIILVCAVEGIMPQTETVIKQALRERVRPVLFINKVDRLIKELKIDSEQMQQRFIKIFNDFNDLIERIAEPEYKEKWKVSINDGSVIFGSARDNWALSVPFMKKKGITFKDILKLYEMNEEERKDWCWKNAPLYEVVLDMVVKHLPGPVEAQKYRIPKIWKGDLESQFGKDLLSCNPNGKIAFVITRIVVDTRAGKEICAGRLFSGTLKEGMEVWLNLAKRKQKIQQVLIYNGIKPEQIPEIGAGNVLAIAGITGEAGETVTLEEEEPFQELKHLFEPVVTQSIEAKKSADLPKLIDVLRTVQKEDPTIKVEIDEETGQHLISGLGELHLEIVTNRIKTEKGVDVKSSPPIVVYRETVTKSGGVCEGRSPNKHNVFFIKVEPIEDEVYEAIKSGEISEGRIKKKNEQLWKKLQDLGISNEEARQYREIYKGCVLQDRTRGEVHIGEIIDMVCDAFEQVVNAGPIAREPCVKLKVILDDTKLHEDAIHRGPAQVYPAVRDAIRGSMQDAKTVMYEPVQILQLEAPFKHMGDVTRLIQSKRGQLLNVNQEMDHVTMKVKMPVAEMIGLAGDLRGATEGRGSFSLVDQLFERMPSEIQEKAVRQIRSRKGLAENE